MASPETDRVIDIIVRHLMALVKALQEMKYKA